MSKETITIYYNPRCAKCREAVALLTERGHNTVLVKYLDTPPDKAELTSLLHKLGMKPFDLIRKGEEIFKQHYAGRTLSDDEWLDAMLTYPVLMERPVVVRGNKAIVARPAEKVLAIL
jgi:arsenate reductase (glutaredoxin)